VLEKSHPAASVRTRRDGRWLFEEFDTVERDLAAPSPSRTAHTHASYGITDNGRSLIGASLFAR
jgi:hypothetical protein